MPTPVSSRLPKPESPVEFENLVADVMAKRWQTPNVYRHGRSGQAQQGVDIYAKPPHLHGSYAAVQCKNVTSLSLSAIAKEVEQARQFCPPLAEFLIATTLDCNARLQREVRELSQENQAKGLFAVEILFWEDISRELAGHRDLLAKYYPDLWPPPDASSHDRPSEDARGSYLRSVIGAERRRHALTAILTGATVSGRTVSLDTVFVPPQLRRAMSSVHEALALTGVSAGDAAGPASLRDWLNAAGEDQKLFVVVGEIGSGKTELLHRALYDLAETALADAHAPIPVLISARDLGSDGHVRLPQTDLLRGLLADRSNRWIYLIDGLDEVDASAWTIAQVLAHEPEYRAARVIATSRPIVPRSLGFTLFLQRWDLDQIERFLQYWEKVDREAVQVLCSSPHYQDGRGELLSSPLTATLCLVVAGQSGALPTGRAALFVRLVEILFQEWARKRGTESICWADVAPVMQSVALQQLKSRLPHVPHELLMRALREKAPDAASELERAVERHFGVLMRLDGGTHYDFLFRGLTEYLAGAALLAQGPGAVLQAAQEPWAEEAVRHAIGIAVERNDVATASRLLDELLQQGRPRKAPARDWLRPLLISIRTAADLGEHARPHARQLLAAVLWGLLEEESCWIGDRIAEALRSLVATNRPLIEMLWRLCQPILMMAEHEPVAWYYGQDRPPAWWIRALYHRDGKVRALACLRLAAHVNEPDVREHLAMMLFDESYPWEAPGLIAGAALRRARRDRRFKPLRRYLQELITGNDYAAAAAAMALLPNEAEPERLAEMYAAIFQGTRQMLAAPVHELAATPRGKAALDAAWPGWQQETLADTWNYLDLFTKDASSKTIPRCPPSHHVRRRILRALSPGLHLLDRSQVEAVIEKTRYANRNELCRALYHRPELLPYLRLDEWPTETLSAEAQRDLGRAAGKHAAIRRALLDAWKKQPDAQRVIGIYPGIALEPLIRASDQEAIQIYAAWLAASPYLAPFYEYPNPDQTVFEESAIKEAAHALVTRVWREAHGYMQDGKPTRLAPSTAGIILQHFWPIWVWDATLVDGLCDWLRGSEEDKFGAAVQAFYGVPLPERVRAIVETRLVDRLRRYLEVHEAPEWEPRRWLQLLAQLESPEAAPLFEKLASLDTPLSPLAAALCLPSQTKKQARTLAGRVAKVGIHAGGGHLPDHHRKALVEAAPGEWFHAAIESLDESQALDPNVLRVLPYLPVAYQQRLARALRDVAPPELPWVRMGAGLNDNHEYGRSADVMDRVLFDVGIPPSNDSKE
jgi:hypothetical protein